MSSLPHVAVIGFPGSNGDHDAIHSLNIDVGVDATLVDYRETSLDGFDAVVLPGGFSYGDALRCGAIARFAPIMTPLKEFAEDGGWVLGICNGFQVLTEAHLLPGALLRNKTLRFHCFPCRIGVVNATWPWLSRCTEGETLTLPVAHGEGAYFVEDNTLAALESNGQVALRYLTDHELGVSTEGNKNGSVAAIAGITNRRGNVLGLMPHPERATNTLVGGTDGLRILTTVFDMGKAESKAS
ncbi:MAG: phosphoribosylformylglycinamidine synthase subunit PurQ [Chloroflexia bacterium]|nr:phosphoribosylformylglycinamidine synthase subunit PurQ [Chloroflexia bacterium]